MSSIKLSTAAIEGVQAVFSSTQEERNHQEKEYYNIVASRVVKAAAHKHSSDIKDLLFSVTTIAASARFGGTRCVAICNSFERAVEMVEYNEGDIFECSYRLVVIEQLRPNYLYGGLDMAPSYWFCWNLETEMYEPIETPEAYKDSFGFGVG